MFLKKNGSFLAEQQRDTYRINLPKYIPKQAAKFSENPILKKQTKELYDYFKNHQLKSFQKEGLVHSFSIIGQKKGNERSEMLDSYPNIYNENGRILEEYAYLEQIPNLI